MKLAFFVAAVAVVAIGCGPSQLAPPREPLQQKRATLVELWEIEISPDLQDAVDELFSDCGNCTNLSVHAFEVNDPPTGPIPLVEAGYAALDQLQLSQLGYGWFENVNRTTLIQRLGNFNYGPLVQDIEGFTGSTNHQSSGFWYSYMAWPDACDNGRFYSIAFNDQRQVVTVEVNYWHEC